MNATFKGNDRSSHISYRKDAHYQKFTQYKTILHLSIITLLNELSPLVCAPHSSALNSHTTTRLDDIILPSALVKNKDILNCFATQMTEVANTATTFLS
jgi:hypothetical protein